MADAHPEPSVFLGVFPSSGFSLWSGLATKQIVRVATRM